MWIARGARVFWAHLGLVPSRMSPTEGSNGDDVVTPGGEWRGVSEGEEEKAGNRERVQHIEYFFPPAAHRKRNDVLKAPGPHARSGGNGLWWMFHCARPTAGERRRYTNPADVSLLVCQCPEQYEKMVLEKFPLKKKTMVVVMMDLFVGEVQAFVAPWLLRNVCRLGRCDLFFFCAESIFTCMLGAAHIVS